MPEALRPRAASGSCARHLPQAFFQDMNLHSNAPLLAHQRKPTCATHFVTCRALRLATARAGSSTRGTCVQR